MATAAQGAIKVPLAYKNLVKILAGMFYGGQCPPPWWVDAADPKKDAPDPEHEAFQQEKKAAQLNREAKRKAQQDTSGLGVILLTSLAEMQWVEEDEFARSLHLPPKMVRKAMRFLEQEQLVQREHRKETVKHRKFERDMLTKAGMRPGPGSKAAAAAGGLDPAAAAAAGLDPEEDEEIVSKGHVITYCSLDFPRIVDSVRLRLHNMKAALKKEINSDDVVQNYKCSHKQCGKKFTSMDVWELLSRDAAEMARKRSSTTAGFTCSICGSDVHIVLDEAGKELGSMEDKRRRQQKAKTLLAAMDAALAPLTNQLQVATAMTPPDLLSYPAWLQNEAGLKQRLQALNAQAGQGGAGAGSSKKQAAMAAFNMDTQVVINFADSSDPNDTTLPSAPAAAAATRGAPPTAAGRAAPVASAAAGVNRLPQPVTALPQPQAPAAKPIPPWLLSARDKSLQAVGMAPVQQPMSSLGFGFGGGIKEEGSSLGMKLDPDGVKLEGLKQDPEFKQELEDADVDALMPGDEYDDGGDDDGAGSVPGGGSTAVDDADDDEWEDVIV